jgi:glycerol kinase
MMGDVVLSIDAGTTSVRCIAFGSDGRTIHTSQYQLTQYYPEPGWVEHDASEILDLCIRSIRDCVDTVGASRISALAITNQRETTVVWDRESGTPVYNAIVWQDRRTQGRCEALKASDHSNRVFEVTGLYPDAYFSASKVDWILRHDDRASERAGQGKLLFGTIDSWILWNISRGRIHATDYTNASRTMLFDIRRLEWDDVLLEEFGVPHSMLPEVMASDSVFGMTDAGILGISVPISAIMGDQQSALFGQGCTSEGDIKITFGTGGFLLMNIGSNSSSVHNGLLPTIAWGAGGHVEYAIEGSVYVAGAAVQWLRDELGIIEDSADSESLACSVEDTGGCYVVPAFTGLGAPYWDQGARGAILGITRGTNRAHLARAVLESLAFQANDVIRSMESGSDVCVRSIKVDGGACRNNFLCQFLADVTGLTVLRPECIESTAYGVARMATRALSVCVHSDNPWCLDRCFEPTLSQDEREAMVSRWHHAVACARMWSYQDH